MNYFFPCSFSKLTFTNELDKHFFFFSEIIMFEVHFLFISNKNSGLFSRLIFVIFIFFSPPFFKPSCFLDFPHAGLALRDLLRSKFSVLIFAWARALGSLEYFGVRGAPSRGVSGGFSSAEGAVIFR